MKSVKAFNLIAKGDEISIFWYRWIIDDDIIDFFTFIHTLSIESKWKMNVKKCITVSYTHYITPYTILWEKTRE